MAPSRMFLAFLVGWLTPGCRAAIGIADKCSTRPYEFKASTITVKSIDNRACVIGRNLVVDLLPSGNLTVDGPSRHLCEYLSIIKRDFDEAFIIWRKRQETASLFWSTVNRVKSWFVQEPKFEVTFEVVAYGLFESQANGYYVPWFNAKVHFKRPQGYHWDGEFDSRLSSFPMHSAEPATVTFLQCPNFAAFNIGGVFNPRNITIEGAPPGLVDIQKFPLKKLKLQSISTASYIMSTTLTNEAFFSDGRECYVYDGLLQTENSRTGLCRWVHRLARMSPFQNIDMKITGMSTFCYINAISATFTYGTETYSETLLINTDAQTIAYVRSGKDIYKLITHQLGPLELTDRLLNEAFSSSLVMPAQSNYSPTDIAQVDPRVFINKVENYLKSQQIAQEFSAKLEKMLNQRTTTIYNATDLDSIRPRPVELNLVFDGSWNTTAKPWTGFRVVTTTSKVYLGINNGQVEAYDSVHTSTAVIIPQAYRSARNNMYVDSAGRTVYDDRKPSPLVYPTATSYAPTYPSCNPTTFAYASKAPGSDMSVTFVDKYHTTNRVYVDKNLNVYDSVNTTTYRGPSYPTTTSKLKYPGHFTTAGYYSGTTSYYPGTTSYYPGTTSYYPGTTSYYPGTTSYYSGTTSYYSGTTSGY